jgi:hypothetical protein
MLHREARDRRCYQVFSGSHIGAGIGNRVSETKVSVYGLNRRDVATTCCFVSCQAQNFKQNCLSKKVFIKKAFIERFYRRGKGYGEV